MKTRILFLSSQLVRPENDTGWTDNFQGLTSLFFPPDQDGYLFNYRVGDLSDFLHQLLSSQPRVENLSSQLSGLSEFLSPYP